MFSNSPLWCTCVYAEHAIIRAEFAISVRSNLHYTALRHCDSIKRDCTLALLWLLCSGVSLHAISRSRRLVDRSLPGQQRFLAVLTFPHFAVWFVHQWQHLLKANGLVKNEQKRNQEKWISSKPSVGKLTKSALDWGRYESFWLFQIQILLDKVSSLE